MFPDIGKRGKRIPPSYGVGQALTLPLTLTPTLAPTLTPTLTPTPALTHRRPRIGAGAGRALLPLRVSPPLRRVVGDCVKQAAQRFRPIRLPALIRPVSTRSSSGQPPASVSLSQLAARLWPPGHTGLVFNIGGSRSARARPARSRLRTTARRHCGLRRLGRRPKAKARGDGNGKESKLVQRPASAVPALAHQRAGHPTTRAAPPGLGPPRRSILSCSCF